MSCNALLQALSAIAQTAKCEHAVALAHGAIQEHSAAGIAQWTVCLTEAEARELRDAIGDGATQAVTLSFSDGHTGRGLYVWSTEYPDDGSRLIKATGASPIEEPTSDSDAQLDQILTWLKARGLYDPRDYQDEGPDIPALLSMHENAICAQSPDDDRSPLQRTMDAIRQHGRPALVTSKTDPHLLQCLEQAAKRPITAGEIWGQRIGYVAAETGQPRDVVEAILSHLKPASAARAVALPNSLDELQGLVREGGLVTNSDAWDIAERLHPYIVQASRSEDVLRDLASFLAVGGYNNPEFDPELFGQKIREGIDILVSPWIEDARKYRALFRPQTADFLNAVENEALHQRVRWGVNHDAGKTRGDWMLLIVALLGKAVSQGHWEDDKDKLLHHLITAAGALLNWHAAETGADSSMRPGLGPQSAPSAAA